MKEATWSFLASDRVIRLASFLGHYWLLIAVVIIPVAVKAIVPRSWDQWIDGYLHANKWVLWIILGLIYLVLIPILWYWAA